MGLPFVTRGKLDYSQALQRTSFQLNVRLRLLMLQLESYGYHSHAELDGLFDEDQPKDGVFLKVFELQRLARVF